MSSPDPSGGVMMSGSPTSTSALVDGRYSVAKAKLDELFIQWLSLPETREFVMNALEEVNKEGHLRIRPANAASLMMGSHGVSSVAASSPPRSPTARTSPRSPKWGPNQTRSPNSSGERKLGVVGRKRPVIPPFYFPQSAARSTVPADDELRQIQELWKGKPKGLAYDDFLKVCVKICGFPSFFTQPLLEKLDTASTGCVTLNDFVSFWAANLKNQDANSRLFRLLKFSEPAREYVSPADWRPYMQALLSSHPGLEFLKATPEFQERYVECVIERIYYVNNKSEGYKLTLKEIQRSNLIKVLKYVDEEEDINKVNDYFSYEHFYVLYCKFWELDTDHDFLLDKDDVLRLGNYALTYRIIDRIFSGAPRPLTSGQPDKMGYTDFIWLLLSEEDKTNPTSIRYWFRCIDLDGDGCVTPYEMEYFYREQMHRMECLSQEVVSFPDILCQMTDMVKPRVEGKICIADLLHCKMGGLFFNVLFNLNKFIQYEQRDPAIIFHERSTPEWTDWDRYAKAEYIRLSMEDEGDEYCDSTQGPWEGERPEGETGTSEAPF